MVVALQKLVGSIDETAKKHQEDMQSRYNQKLAKIKDVCAQYFSKYEKHLLHQAEMVKQLEVRQEDWVNKLIKPQEVNQARLFSVDTRIKEGELMRLKDHQFIRDTFKKLIYAIEQNSMARQAQGTQTDPVPRPMSYCSNKRGTKSGYGQSVADQNFGSNGNLNVLPNLLGEGNVSTASRLVDSLLNCIIEYYKPQNVRKLLPRRQINPNTRLKWHHGYERYSLFKASHLPQSCTG